MQKWQLRDFSWKLLLIPGTLILAGFAGISAVASIARDRNPAAILRYAPNDAGALAGVAEMELTKEKAPTSKIASLGRKSLVEQALNARAIRIVGETYVLSNHSAHATQMFEFASRASRREVGANIALIEANVARGNMAGALRYYDIAMRTNSGARSALFPILANAISDTSVRSALIPILRRNPPWMLDFLLFAGFNDATLGSTVQLIAGLGQLPADVYFGSFETRMLDQLFSKARYAEAASFYKRMRGADPALLSSFTLDASPERERFQPIAWQLFSSPEADVSLVKPADKRANATLLVSAGPTQSGVVARKYAFLGPGRYVLRSETKLSVPSQNSIVRWELNCHNTSQTIPITVDVRPSEGWISNTANFLVTPDCLAVEFSLVVSGGGGSDQEETSIAARNLTISRVGPL